MAIKWIAEKILNAVDFKTSLSLHLMQSIKMEAKQTEVSATKVNGFFQSKKIQVFGGIRPILRSVNLYDSRGLRIGSFKIPDFIIYLSILTPLIFIASLEILFCIDEQWNLATMSTVFAMAAGTVQMILVYVSLASKNHLIVDTIDLLQQVAEKSKFCDFKIE